MCSQKFTINGYAMRKSILFIFLAIFLLILVFLKIFRGCREEAQKPAAAVIPPVSAEGYIARDTTLNFPFSTVGYIRANEKTDIVSELPGRVVSIHFREGGFIRKGELLFLLDDSEYQASLKKIEAQLELAQRAEERNSAQLASGGISQHVFDESAAHRKVMEAEADLLRVTIRKAAIRAPFTGKTGIRNVSDGAYVKPGEVLTTLEDLALLKVDFSVPQRYAGIVHVSDPLSFTVTGNPAVYPGRVMATDPSVDRHTGNLRVLATVSAHADELVPGTAVTVSLAGKPPVPSLYIPTQALLPTPAGYDVYALSAGKCTLRHVKTGLRSKAMAEITQGVEPGDTILVTGLMRVRPGNSVHILKTW